ncbi:ATP-binding protein [Actinacidiphila soli]|uniref:ATP-binding protein n=1 Tax=Actinacidiphila soli TaxID=2487275 RepID=UPI000FCADCD1|nr:ATP-binding protein [Actinacidiphila soli]
MLTLPPEPASVAMARRTAEYVYGCWGVNPGHPVVGPALLILSELVTNCVRHAAESSAALDVIYAADEGVLAFAVHDRHPRQPDLIRLAKPAGGLAMIVELTAELGGTATLRPDADGGGKSIWITLPLQ